VTAARIAAGKPIYAATRNADKLRELRALWGPAPPRLITPAAMPDVDECFDTYEQNALAKAAALMKLLFAPALADDSGIEVKALEWKPGVRSARTPSADSTPHERNAFILSQLGSTTGEERRARFVCVCALVLPDEEPLIARGEVEGLIAAAPRGTAGFGYDPIFYYEPFGMTFAEAGPEAKNAVSHRGNAIRRLREMIAPLITR